MFGLGYQEIVVVCVIGVLLFGKKLPQVGRYLGQSIIEFQKGVRGIEDDVESIKNMTIPTPKKELHP